MTIRTYTLLFVFFVLCSFPARSFAATIHFDAQSTSTLDSDISLNVSLDTEHESINAFTGTIVYPQGLLELKEIRDGNSVINFWITKPAANTPGMVSFSGITPGGFSGDHEEVLTLVFHTIGAGTGSFELSNAQALKNDGQGTAVALHTAPFTLHVLAGQDSNAVRVDKIDDTDPPENFAPLISQSPDIYDGQYFVAFSTEDKGSGIDHYEIKEGFFGSYHEAESPFVLTHQALDRKIYVKAVDKNGNTRVSTLPAEHAPKWYEQYVLFVILIVLGAVWYVYKKYGHAT